MSRQPTRKRPESESGDLQTSFLSYSTHDVPTHRKVAFWDEHASDVITHLHVEPGPEHAFDASLKATEFGGVGFIEAISPLFLPHGQFPGVSDCTDACFLREPTAHRLVIED